MATAAAAAAVAAVAAVVSVIAVMIEKTHLSDFVFLIMMIAKDQCIVKQALNNRKAVSDVLISHDNLLNF